MYGSLVAQQLLILAAMVATGVLIRKAKRFSDEMQKSSSELLMTVILPCSILESSDFEGGTVLSGMGTVLTISIAFFIVSALLLRLIAGAAKLERGRREIFLVSPMSPNVSYVGFPVCLAMLGGRSLFYATIINIAHAVMLFTYAESLYSGRKRIALKSILLAPANLASFAAVLMVLSGVRLPSVLQSAVSSVGAMGVPLSMLVTGSMLADTALKKTLFSGMACLISALRLLLLPVLLVIGLWLLKVPYLPAMTAGICLSGPVASFNAILAGRYDCAPKLSAVTVSQSMVLSIFTMPLIISLLERLVG